MGMSVSSVMYFSRCGAFVRQRRNEQVKVLKGYWLHAAFAGTKEIIPYVRERVAPSGAEVEV